MPRIQLQRGYPFPAAATKWQNPIPDEFWDPKAWGTEAVFVAGPDFFQDLSAHFVDDGIEIDDVLFVVDAVVPTKSAHVVTGVNNNTQLFIIPGLAGGLTAIVYKVGMKVHHTQQTLAKIITARGIHGYTFHWKTLWTPVPFVDFDDDENGDVYCIDPPAGGRLQDLKDEWEAANPASVEPNPWDSLTPRPKT